MATVCPANFDINYLRAQVRATYDRVAREPHGEFHFHRGSDYAHAYLGYNQAELATLPEACTARFAGVGNPLRIGDRDASLAIRAGEIVLDHACGAGMDLLLAARRTGPAGRAIGIDMTPVMCECATAAAELAGLADRVEIRVGYYESLPVVDESIDVVISNGGLNLAPDKHRVFQEIYRVLKPGGRLLLADVVVHRDLTLEARSNPDLWAACIAGAMKEEELTELAAAVGLSGSQLMERFDCFHNTSAEAKVSKDLQVQSVNFSAYKLG